jgi:hypothetical protein
MPYRNLAKRREVERNRLRRLRESPRFRAAEVERTRARRRTLAGRDEHRAQERRRRQLDPNGRLIELKRTQERDWRILSNYLQGATMRPTASDTHTIRKKLVELDRIVADVDYKRSAICHELRGKFTPGVNGDRAFCKWFVDELGYGDARCQEMLRRAQAFKLVPDVDTWNKHKGFDKIGKLLDLDKREQVACMQDAAVSGKLLESVVRERAAKKIDPPAPSSGNATPINDKSDEEIVVGLLRSRPAVELAPLVLALTGVPHKVLEAARRLKARLESGKRAA